MDINNIALIIITAFINLAVSTFVFSRYQKKIEDSFARSFLEYQTKFVRNHEKTVETLESTYKQFAEITSSIQDVSVGIFETSGELPDEKRRRITYKDINSVESKVAQLNLYLLNHEIYLPDNIKTMISDLVGRSLEAIVLTRNLFFYYKDKNKESIDMLRQNLNLKTKKNVVVTNKEDIKVISIATNKINENMFNLLRELELIYKSYIEIETKD